MLNFLPSWQLQGALWALSLPTTLQPTSNGSAPLIAGDRFPNDVEQASPATSLLSASTLPCPCLGIIPADAWAQPGDTDCLHHILLQKFCTREALCKCFVHAGQMWWNHGEKKAATVLSWTDHLWKNQGCPGTEGYLYVIKSSLGVSVHYSYC